MIIPGFLPSGVLPPYLASPPDRAGHSPYATTTLALVKRFGTSQERRAILHGLLGYRDRLRVKGMLRLELNTASQDSEAGRFLGSIDGD